MAKDTKLEDIVSLAKRRGFIYPGSDVYGGLSGTWDYGPLGVQLKRNIMNLWWKMFVDERDDMYGVDAAILMNQKVWQASGHVDTFTDPLVECQNCKSRFRTDKLIDAHEYEAYLLLLKERFVRKYESIGIDSVIAAQNELGITDEQRNKYKQVLDDIELKWQKNSTSLHDARVAILAAQDEARKYLGEVPKDYLNGFKACPNCGKSDYSDSRQFNMMFSTVVGPNFRINHVLDLEGNRDKNDYDTELKYVSSAQSYLRPETAQGIFTNYKNVVDSFYPDLPFGIAQQGKAFRNEISPRDFIFRSREFEQMEIEYFVNPEKWEEAFEHWVEQCKKWFDELGLDPSDIHELEVPGDDRAHYSRRTIDFEFDFPIGREELMGLAYRTDFDLKNIHDNSGKSMEYTVKGTNTKFIPHVIEPSFGVERALMAVLTSAYTEDEVNGEKRVVMKFPEHLAPVLFAVSPLLKNKPELVEKAREVYKALSAKHPGRVMWDDNGNIGKRYRRQDEIGTPHCVVIDFQTLEDDTVTVRDRDTTEQKRIPSKEV